MLLRNFAFQRASVAALVFAVSVVAAKVLGEDQYGPVALFVFLVKSLQICNFGSPSGFIVQYYSSKSDAVADANWFVTNYAFHLVGCAIVAGLIAWIASAPVYMWSSLAFLAMAPLLAMEPAFRINRAFWVSLLPDLLLSSSIIVLILLSVTKILPTENQHDAFLVLFLAVTGASVLFGQKVLRAFFRAFKNRPVKTNAPFKYSQLMVLGLPRFVATATLTLFLLVDRLFLERFYEPSALSVYMLAYQLALGAGLLLSAQNLVSGIDFGEAVRSNSLHQGMMKVILKRAALLAVLGFVGALVLAYLLENYFLDGFDGLFSATALLAFAWLVYLSVSNLTEVTFYVNAYVPVLVSLLIMFLLSVVFNLFQLLDESRDQFSLIAFTAFLLVACSLFIYKYVIRFFGDN